MTSLRRTTAIAAALTLLALPALAQTQASPSAEAPTTDQGMAQPHDMGGQDTGAMHEMMRAMMTEMMEGKPPMDGERSARAQRRDGERWHHGSRMDRKMRDGRAMRGSRDDMQFGMMHGAGMKIVFAIVDADGDGALSLDEIQDFHGRIFKAVDQNKDGKVEMTEIETFFHGNDEEPEE